MQKIEALPKYEEMTMEMYFQLHPESAFNIDKPTFWPHNAEEEIGYLSPEQKAAKENEGH